MLHFIVAYPLAKSQQFVVGTSSDTELSFTKSYSLKKRGTKGKDKLTLDDVLRNKFGYRALIKHLSSEFCMENLLSMTEFLMFKAFVHRKYVNSQMNKDLRYWLTLCPLA